MDTSQKLEQIVRSMDTSKTLEQIARSMDTSKTLEQVSQSMDTSKTLEQIVRSMDTSKTLEQIARSMDTSKVFEQIARSLDTSKAFDQIAARLRASGVFERFADQVSLAQPSQVATEVVEVVEEAAAAMAGPTDQQLDLADPTVRLAIAAYVFLMLMTLFVYGYLEYPTAAAYVLDAESPLAWSWLAAIYIYRRLGDTGSGSDKN